MLKRIFNYISENLSGEIHNFPLWIPVFISCGIAFYFHLYNEPKSWFVNTIFGVSLFILIFLNAGNSSDKIKKYKKIFAWSTLKYILKKVLKFTIFLFFIPVLGHITLFLLVGGWVYSIFEYSKFLKYFALLYDNALMKDILKGIKFIFAPIINWFKRTFLFSFSKDVVKTSHSKKDKSEKLWKLLLRKTKDIYRFLMKILKKFFHNPLFMFIAFLNKKINKFFKKLKQKVLKVINLFIPKRVIQKFVQIVFSVNFILFFFIFGFFLIKLRTNMLDTNLLFSKLKDAQVVGRLIEVEYFDDDYRFTVDKVSILNYSDVKVDKVRVKVSKKFGLPLLGDYIKFESTLLPPFLPNVVGGFDFARYSYYKKLSASGRISKPWEVVNSDLKNTYFEDIYFKFLNMRDFINKRIEKINSENTSGVIMSMMTGERYSVPKDISENYNSAGISHLLSISGIHMTLIVGVAFLFIRLLLALYMPIASRYNTKKLAVFFALFVATFYLLLSGARISTQRAFITIFLGLIAILIDRSPFSLRFLSITAIIILVLSPEALINAGFQMSFLAVITLIKLYEYREYWIIKNDELEGVKKKFLDFVNIVWANILVAFCTSLVIAPVIIYHFNSIQIYSVLGNLFAIPICSIIVMPAILLSFFAFPFGLEYVPLKITEFGVDAINFVAKVVAKLPYASFDVKSMSMMALLLIIAGIMWFFIWQRKWRYFGIIPVVCGIYLYIFAPVPSIFANKYGQVFGIVSDNQIKVVNNSSYPLAVRLIDDWKKVVGVSNSSVEDKKILNINGVNVAFINKFFEYKKVCQGEADVIFTGFDSSKAYYKCNKKVFDRKFFKFSEGAEFFISKGKISYKTVEQYIGKRPWNMSEWQQDYTIPKNILNDFKVFE